MERNNRKIGEEVIPSQEYCLTPSVKMNRDGFCCSSRKINCRRTGWGLFVCWLIFFYALPMIQAQQPEAWALKMFSQLKTERVHNFGNLALHAEAEHHFVFKNIYKENVEILSAQSNCGCTKVTVPKKVIKPGETGDIVARVDTTGKVHTGKRKVTITVYFDRPQSAEVQLQIQAFIRSDVVFNPGNVEFGGIAQGKESNKKVYLEYHGSQSNWNLTQIKKTDPGIKAVAKPIQNTGSGIKTYEVTITIKDSAEPGYINDLVRFISNDGEDHSIFIPVHAQILAPLSAKPSYLQLGVVHPGEEVSKNIVIRGSEPFKIEKISSTDPNMKFLTANQTSQVHVIPVTYRADENAHGSIHQVITVKTSQTDIPDLEIDVSGFVSEEPTLPVPVDSQSGNSFEIPSETTLALALGILNQPIPDPTKPAIVRSIQKRHLGNTEIQTAEEDSSPLQTFAPTESESVKNNSRLQAAEQPSLRTSQISQEKTQIRRKPVIENLTADTPNHTETAQTVPAKEAVPETAENTLEPAVAESKWRNQNELAENKPIPSETAAEPVEMTDEVIPDEGWVSVKAESAENPEPSEPSFIPYSVLRPNEKPEMKSETDQPVHLQKQEKTAVTLLRDVPPQRPAPVKEPETQFLLSVPK